MATVNNTGPFPVGVTTVIWSATDSASNTGIATQTVTIVDTMSPVITILGTNPLNLNIGDTYTEAGATATDLVDGNVTATIVTTGAVNTAIAGPYEVTYTVTDVAGNTSTSKRTVNVGPVRTFTGLLPSGANGTISFTSGDPNCSFSTNPEFIDESTVTPAPPAEIDFIDGVAKFIVSSCASGATIEITVDYGVALPADTKVWKSGTPWFVIPSTVNGTTIKFSVTDGGIGDADGVVNGEIKDPFGAARLRVGGTTTPAASIPVNTPLGLLLLVILLMVFGSKIRNVRIKS